MPTTRSKAAKAEEHVELPAQTKKRAGDKAKGAIGEQKEKETKKPATEASKAAAAKDAKSAKQTTPPSPSKASKEKKEEKAPVGSAPAEAAEEEQTPTTASGVGKKAPIGKLTVGSTLPDLELETDQAEKVKLSSLYKDQGMIIFFYPRANTPGCTTQACGFRDKREEVETKGYKIYGASADKPTSQSNWKKKHDFGFTLLCDPEHKLMKPLGVSNEERITRSHIIVEKGGKIKEMNIKVSPMDSVNGAVASVVG